MNNPVIIIGVNPIGKAAFDIFIQNEILMYCFLDEDESLHGQELFDIAIMGSPKDDGFLKYIGKKCDAFVAFSDQKKRRKWVNLLEKRRKVLPKNAIHPKSSISQYARIGEGNFIDAGVYIGANTEVNNFCSIQPNASIASDCHLEKYINIGANAAISERVTIGENALIGAGSIIMPGISIGRTHK